MQIKIVFHKSSSKYYDSCCLKCEQLFSYQRDKNINIVLINDDEFRAKRELISSILETVRHWTKSKFYIDDMEVSDFELEKLYQVLDCETEKNSEVVDRDHCYTQNGWGCSKLEEISLRSCSYYNRSKYYWYEFGHFENDQWVIDKSRIKMILDKEIQRKRLEICKFFDIDRIHKEIDNLPGTIEVIENGEWCYKYREAPAGIPQTEIIGVVPKEDTETSHEGFGGISIRLSDFLKDDKSEQIKNTPNVTFGDIGGIDDIVQQVREVIELPILAPEIFEHYHLEPHKGILLYGPPGCGKTLIAKAIANEVNAHFITVNGPEILNKYIGQSEENLRKIFEEAKAIRPSIIYFDEFDAIATKRDSDDHLALSTVVNQLLTLMDGVSENDVCCIASTNRIDMIDDAIKRPGRFDYVIEIKKPSPEGCRQIFKIHTGRMPVDTSFNKDDFVEKYLVGLSGAEIAFVVSEAAYNSIRRTIDISSLFSSQEKPTMSERNVITELDFINAAKTLRERKRQADTAKYRYNL